MFHKRYSIVWTIAASLALIALAACTPQAEESASADVGIMVMAHMFESMDDFQDAMTELGYVDGETIIYHIYDFAEGEVPTQEEADNLDLIVTLEAGEDETEPLSIAYELSNDETPILFISDNNYPVEGGYVETLTSPGKNVTGVIQTAADDRRFELFQQMLPDPQRILIPYDNSDPDALAAVELVVDLADELGIETIVSDTLTVDDYLENPAENLDGIFLVRVYAPSDGWFALAQEQGLPLSYEGKTNVAADGSSFLLMNYIEDDEQMSAQMANLADQILNGAIPGDLPVETGALQLILNLITAEELNLELPDAILEQADEIIRPADTAG